MFAIVMKDIKINPNHIVSIVKYIRYRLSYYEFINKPATFFRKSQIGFMNKDFNTLYSLQQLTANNNNVIIEDNIVYLKPHLTYRMLDKQEFTIYFDSEEELNASYPELWLFTLPQGV